MDKNHPDPGDPDIVARILEHQKELTREQWLERLASVPGIVAENPFVAEELRKSGTAGSIVVKAVGLPETARDRPHETRKQRHPAAGGENRS